MFKVSQNYHIYKNQRFKPPQIKSLLLSHHHSTCALVSEILESVHPDAAFIITGDFNKANFGTIAPKYFQHGTINTRGDRILDHCYTSFRDAYKSFPRPPFGKSDHSSVLLLPAYRQKLKREAPALRTIQCLSDQSDAILQDCFDHVDWDMFRAASDDDIEAYSDTVTCFIRKCIEDVVPTKTIRIYPHLPHHGLPHHGLPHQLRSEILV